MTIAPTDEDKFAMAERLWASGRPRAATQLHVDLTRNGADPELRLRSALALVERLNPAFHVEVILEACATGIEMAERLGENSTVAYLMALRAKNVAIFNGFLVTSRKEIRLAPGWLGFSLKRDEQQHKELTVRIEANDAEIDRLLREARKGSGDQTTLGHVLLSIGHICIQRYFSLKADGLVMSVRLPSFVRAWLKRYALDEYLWYRPADRQAMRRQLRECESAYVEAGAAFHASGDELNEGIAFYNLANDLRSAFRFRKAVRYLKRTEIIAKHSNNSQLLEKIPILKERIRLRNKNVPNYAGGEGQPNEDV